MRMDEVLPDLAQAMDIDGPAPKPNRPQGTQGTKPPQSAEEKNKRRELERRKDSQLRPGKKVKLPTDQGKEAEFKVTRDMGDEVEIENPEGQNDPNQPNKLVYNKQDLKKGMRVDKNENS